MELPCPSQGNKCSRCLGIARQVFGDEYRETNATMSDERIAAIVEDSRIVGPLEEDGSLTGINCTDRKRRAEIIGRQVAKNARELR